MLTILTVLVWVILGVSIGIAGGVVMKPQKYLDIHIFASLLGSFAGGTMYIALAQTPTNFESCITAAIGSVVALGLMALYTRPSAV